MTASNNDLADPIPTPRKGSPFRAGCLIALAVVLAPWLLNVSFLGLRNEFNHAKWRLRGSSSYTATIHRTLLGMMDKVTLHVSNGDITAVESSFCPDCIPSQYEDYTVDRQFGNVLPLCGLAFPLWICHITYDPYFGYPTDIVTDCAIPASECWGTEGVDSLILLAD